MIDPTPPPESTGNTSLADGRELHWARWGHQEAHPVLFCTGAAMSCELGFPLPHRGLRIIGVDRPGIGGSTPAPQHSLDDWAADIDELAERWRLDSFSVLGFSQGAPFALACAARGTPRAAIIVSGLDELTRPSFTALYEAQLADLLRAAREEPAQFEAEIAARTTPETMRQLVLTSCGEHDREFYRSPDFAPAHRTALRRGLRQGPAGHAHDLRIAFSPWPFDPADIAIPVDLWYGEHDHSPAHSPDQGQLLAIRLPNARRRVVPGSGGCLLWTHTEAIFESVPGG